MTTANSVYVAGKFTARERLRPVKAALLARGIPVTSTWIEADADSQPFEERALTEARRDLAEVRMATLMIIDTLDESNTGGREVELGGMLILGKEVWRVGPPRNIFHYMIRNTYTTWDELFNALDH